MTVSYLQNKKIVLGVTGCIGAYKAAELIRLLKKEGAEVRVIMTSSAKEKLRTKNIDIIVGNLVGENQGFNRDENELIIFTKAGEQTSFGKKSKVTLGYELMKLIARDGF